MSDVLKATPPAAPNIPAKVETKPEGAKTDAAKAVEIKAASSFDRLKLQIEGFILSNDALNDELKDLAKYCAAIPIVGALIVNGIFSTAALKKLGIEGSTDDVVKFLSSLGKTAEDIAKIEKNSKQFLQENFQTENLGEVKILSLTSLGKFLEEKPADFDQKRYDYFKKALLANGAADAADKNVKVFEFIIPKMDKWVKPPEDKK